ncbi:ABC transporter permease [Phorcysia thermohydrogeniphila]|uniref:Putative ABC transport system permease protein n=1 Tax=Phorcysia thermohydrogeniphila TaxID=936138 RepID=A0A4R1GK58_9BACT|nr:ABC transporter permease [Phorcysia thermohydrogeniphila]TCK06389.1 putative ABC transport system permease protein [Phorcysia thermohydrogeniphila]
METFGELLIVTLSYLLILAVVLLDRKFEIGLWRELLTSSVLSLIQLIGVGFVILFLFKLQLKAVYPLFILLFYVNAAIISTKRFTFKGYSKRTGFLISFISIASISSVSLLFLFLSGILKIKANSIIPLAGIVTAAGMRSLSLAFKYYATRLKDLEDIIVSMAALGASDTQIFKFIFREIINDVTIPTRDMLRSAGIVHIPGVMVGLLLAGTLPLKAAVIQFAILATMIFQFFFVPSLALFTLIATCGLKIEK